MRKLLLIAIIAIAATPIFGQGFPWDIFKPRTLKEVIDITTKGVRSDDSMFLATNQLESKVDVTYTGQSRPIIDSRQAFIRIWAKMLEHPGTTSGGSVDEYVAHFDREYLYRVEDKEYWIATSKPITKYFDKELKRGDKMTLYLISIGAYRTKDGIDCVLLVEEYQK